jgi:hypothetical protein
MWGNARDILILLEDNKFFHLWFGIDDKNVDAFQEKPSSSTLYCQKTGKSFLPLLRRFNPAKPEVEKFVIL